MDPRLSKSMGFLVVSGTGPLVGLQINVETSPGKKVICPDFVGYPLQSIVTVSLMVP